MAGKSEAAAMQELAGLMWARYLRQRVKEELNHELNGYKAEVVTNNGDGTLTVKRPFETNTLTIRASASAFGVEAGEQVILIGMGDKSKALSNAFALCATDMLDYPRKPTEIDFSDWDNGSFSADFDGSTSESWTVTFDAQDRPIKFTDSSGHETVVTW